MYNFIKNTFVKKLFFALENFRLKYENLKVKDIPFKSVGKDFRLGKDYSIHNPQYMEIGDYFRCLDRLRLDTYDEYMGDNYSPQLIIGNNANFNNDIHIACINRVIIGNNVMLASKIYITDHDHGTTEIEMLDIPPLKRPLHSKGAVIIEDNVWIGEGVCILSGVTIGRNSIIAANAVVTKDVPPNSVAGGIPAKILKAIYK